MRVIGLTGFVAALIALAATASAATLDGVSGQVYVDKGKGPQLVRGTVQVNPGDVVTVGAGGSARIVYSGGCSMPVASASMTTVTMDGQCVSAAADSSMIGLAGSALIGGTLVYIAAKDRSASP